MNHISYLKKNNFTPSSINKKKLNELSKNGYCLIKSEKKFWEWIDSSPKKIRNVVDKLLKTEGIKAGSEGKEEFTNKKKRLLEPGTNRLSNLLNKNKVFRKISTYPLFIFFAKEIIKNEFKISAVEFREPKKVIKNNHYI